MATLKIVKFGSAVLAQATSPVTEWGDALATLVRDMEETMHAARGIGLAANQVGLPLRLAIIDLQPGTAESELHVLVNPEIVESSGALKEEEGCLSIPGLVSVVERPATMVVRCRDLSGEERVIEGEGLLARALSHEIDHLDGRLFPQRIAGVRGELVRRRMRKMLRSGEWDDVTP